jgi:hypothetical protein
MKVRIGDKTALALVAAGTIAYALALHVLMR